MSQIDIISPKHCAQKGLRIRGSWVSKKLVKILSSTFVSLLAMILLVYFMLHPSKPEFTLKQADLRQLSISPASLLNSSLFVTFLSKNPNQRVGIHYDDIEVCALYKGQPITQRATVPPYYQDHEDANTLTASLAASSLPVARYLGYQVVRDQTAVGKVIVTVMLSGRMRWKVGSWTSSSHTLKVSCAAMVALNPGAPSNTAPAWEQASGCSTSL